MCQFLKVQSKWVRIVIAAVVTVSLACALVAPTTCMIPRLDKCILPMDTNLPEADTFAADELSR